MTTPIADWLERVLSGRRRVDVGSTEGAALVAAVRALELRPPSVVVKDEAHAKHRAWDRDYQRRKRAAKSTFDKKNESSPHTPLPSPSNSSSPFLSLTSEGSKPSKEEERERIRARARGTRLPDDWMPTLDDLAFARTLLHSSVVTTQVDTFRDYWTGLSGQRAVKKDWSATWRNWCRKHLEWDNGHNHRKNGHESLNGGKPETWKEKRARENYEALQELKSYGSRNAPREGSGHGEPADWIVPDDEPPRS